MEKVNIYGYVYVVEIVLKKGFEIALYWVLIYGIDNLLLYEIKWLKIEIWKVW